MRFFYVLIFCFQFVIHSAIAQQLDSILPVLKSNGALGDSVSFILTASDYNLWRGLPVKYTSSIQIVDAADPWPPRWFATAPIDGDIQTIPFINATQQNDKVVFANAISRRYRGGQIKMQEAMLSCNRAFELTDTFYKAGLEIDVHDFAINKAGEKLYFAVYDTVVNLKDFIKGAKDSAVSISYERIQIDNSNNETIFSWSPIENLGLNAMYQPYCFEKSVINKSLNFEWSHANSLCWDKDGNILYSFKYIGIGKISRTDGHTIWRVDRNKQRVNSLSDSLPIFLQHDLHFVEDNSSGSIYTVFSNGDSLSPYCSAYQFKISECDSGYKLKLLKSFVSADIKKTGGGNYDVYPSGHYLINYGLYRDSLLSRHVLFEYRSVNDSIIARYSVLANAFCYRVHRFLGELPLRPNVIEKSGILTSASNNKGNTWYELSGKNMEVVKKVNSSSTFKPTHNGNYCVVVKQGIGYSVSKVFKYRKQGY